jgi:hypothetical protein
MIHIICIYDVWLWSSVTYLSCVSCSVSLQNDVGYSVFVLLEMGEVSKLVSFNL